MRPPEVPVPTGPAARLAVAVALAAVGAATGLATLAVHTRGWGLPLAALASVAALLALPPGWWSRLALAAGWALPVALAYAGRPEGDYVLSRAASGYAVLLLAVVLVGVAVGSLGAGSEPSRSGT